MFRQWSFEKIRFVPVKGFAILGVWICLSGSLLAANFWEERFFTSWTEEEIEQMLTDSPWSRKVTVVLDESRRSRARRRAANAAGERDDGRRLIPPSDIPPLEGIGPVPERMTVTVSWRSALPVKQALENQLLLMPSISFLVAEQTLTLFVREKLLQLLKVYLRSLKKTHSTFSAN